MFLTSEIPDVQDSKTKVAEKQLMKLLKKLLNALMKLRTAVAVMPEVVDVHTPKFG